MLGLPSSTALVVGSIIGTGVFTMPAVLAGAGTSSLITLGAISVGALMLTACGSSDGGSAKAKDDGKITMGFAQVGAESGWRTANTKSNATKGGADNSDNTKNQESEKRLEDPNQDSNKSDGAATGEGGVSLAAAVAVSIVDGDTDERLEAGVGDPPATIHQVDAVEHLQVLVPVHPQDDVA